MNTPEAASGRCHFFLLFLVLSQPKVREEGGQAKVTSRGSQEVFPASWNRRAAALSTLVTVWVQVHSDEIGSYLTTLCTFGGRTFKSDEFTQEYSLCSPASLLFHSTNMY